MSFECSVQYCTFWPIGPYQSAAESEAVDRVPSCMQRGTSMLFSCHAALNNKSQVISSYYSAFRGTLAKALQAPRIGTKQAQRNASRDGSAPGSRQWNGSDHDAATETDMIG